MAFDFGAVGQRTAERGPAAAALSSVCPPAASAITRAANGLARPSTSRGLAPRAMSGGAVLAQRDRADVQADTGPQRQRGECLVVVQRVAQRIERHVEQQEKAIAAIDLAPVVARQQVARPAIVLGPQLRGARVTQLLDQQRAVHHVGEEQRALGHRRGSDGTLHMRCIVASAVWSGKGSATFTEVHWARDRHKVEINNDPNCYPRTVHGPGAERCRPRAPAHPGSPPGEPHPDDVAQSQPCQTLHPSSKLISLSLESSQRDRESQEGLSCAPRRDRGAQATNSGTAPIAQGQSEDGDGRRERPVVADAAVQQRERPGIATQVARTLGR